MQRLLKQIDRLYGFECWFSRLGDCKPWSKHVVGIEFKDIPFPILPGPTCLVSPGKTTPLPPAQPRISGQVRDQHSRRRLGSTSRSATTADMADYNEKHMSTWSGAELSKVSEDKITQSI